MEIKKYKKVRNNLCKLLQKNTKTNHETFMSKKTFPFLNFLLDQTERESESLEFIKIFQL